MAATLCAWTSEPPASGSSRSLQASRCTWLSPASAARSPIALSVRSPAMGSVTCRSLGRFDGPTYATRHPRAGRECGVAIDTGAPVRLTGERPLEGQTPDSLLALHAAGYREVRERIGPGRFLDLGCGVGTGTAGFAGEGRVLVGVDYDPATAAEARRLHADVDLVTLCGDGSSLPLRAGSFDDVCSSHLIEHFVEPEHH